MATRTITIDDITEREVPTKEVKVTVDGKTATLDLGQDSRDALVAMLSGDVSALRALLAPRARRSVRTPEESEAIRVWARANGFTVNDRGRIADEVVAAYETATGADAGDEDDSDES